jgi:predicted TIM-barrel fold metal-dependent hydrolase
MSAPRREFLGRLAVLGAAAILPRELAAQAAAKAYRIDVHHHLAYPGYLEEAGGRRAGSIFKWSPQMSLEDMDKSGIELSVLSLIQPSAVTTDVAKGRRIARASNEYGAQLARDHKGRFASFATLPLLDTEGSLREIAYALDTLKAAGIALMTSYQDKYLGDPLFAPVWEELNRRKAVVYTHPLSPECCKNIRDDVPPAVIEYATDTTRTIASLVFSGTASRYPDIRWIFSHSGGTMPFLLSRFVRQEIDMKEKAAKAMPKGVMYELKKFHYDTAQGNHWGALAALMKIVAPSQVLFGTDFPFRDGAEEIGGLTEFRFRPDELRAIERDNALKLLPALTA